MLRLDKFKKVLYYIQSKGIWYTILLIINRYIFLIKPLVDRFNIIKIKKILSMINSNTLIIVSHNCSRTGAPFVALNLGKALQKYNQTNVIFLSLAGGDILKDFADIAPLIVLHQREDRTENNPFLQIFFNEISKNNNILGVVCNSVVSAQVIPYLEKADLKYSNIIHELTDTIKNKNYVTQSEYIANYSKNIIFPTRYVEKDFKKEFGCKKANSVILPQGVNLINKLTHDMITVKNLFEKQFGISSECKVVLGCGTDFYRKGVDHFFTIAKRITMENKNIHFIWLGDKDYPFFQSIESELRGESFKNNIHFIESLDSPELLFARSDIFLMTSRVDPFPTVVLDAMNFHTPVIAFKDSGGIFELLEDDNGVIIEEFDIASMQKECLLLLNDNKLHDKYAKNAYQLISNKINYKYYAEERNYRKWASS